jgi:hypothetical protein
MYRRKLISLRETGFPGAMTNHLHRLIGQWPSFLVQLAASPVAFELECALFHEVRRLDFPHPVRPAGTDITCAICGAWGSERTAMSDRVKFYQEKAPEVRATAEKFQPSARRPLIRLAESYERLAAVMESKEPKSDGQ